MSAPRIALIHATPLAIEPVNTSFKKLWPEASLQNILDDSLSRDHAAAGHLTADMVERFIDLAQYAKRAGCQAFCSHALHSVKPLKRRLRLWLCPL